MASEQTGQISQSAPASHGARNPSRTRPRDLTEQLNVFAKAVAVAVLVALIGIGTFGRFYTARFNGLVSTTAMEVGDIAQQLRSGRGMSTHVIRPLALAYGQPNEEGVIPETLHAPLYPLLLSWFFKVRGGGDASVVMLNGLAYLLTGWVLYLISGRLWDKTTALLVVILYFVSVEALGGALTASGASLTGLLLTVAIWAALRQRQTAQGLSEASLATGKQHWFLWPAAVGGLFGLAYLAGPIPILLVIPLILLATTQNHWRRQAAVIISVALLVMVPWFVRNLRVSRTLLPALASYKLLTNTSSYPEDSVFQHLPGQVPAVHSFVVNHPLEIMKKMAWGITHSYRQAPNVVSPYLFPFFILGGFLFGSDTARRALWRAVVAMLVLQVLAVSLGDHNAEAFRVLTPIAICLAVGTGIQALRETAAPRFTQVLVGMAILVLVLFATVSSMVLGGKAEVNRSGASLAILRENLASDAMIATDNAAAVAWYAYRPAVLLPDKPEGLAVLGQHGIDVDYVYFSHQVAGSSSRSILKPWHDLLKSQKAAEYLGEPLALPHGEVVFERNSKRASGDVGSSG